MPCSNGRHRWCVSASGGDRRRRSVYATGRGGHPGAQAVCCVTECRQQPVRCSGKREKSADVGTNAAGANPPIRDRGRPIHATGRELKKCDRIGLHQVRWRASRVPWPFDALNRTVRRNTHLHRTARSRRRKMCQQCPNRSAERQTFRRSPRSQGLQSFGHRWGYFRRGGHKRTIQDDIHSLCTGPGSRNPCFTRHSGERCIPAAPPTPRSLWDIEELGRRWP